MSQGGVTTLVWPLLGTPGYHAASPSFQGILAKAVDGERDLK